jgi:hypothetical protein
MLQRGFFFPVDKTFTVNVIRKDAKITNALDPARCDVAKAA